MPELPEVETIKSDLGKAILGKTIIRVRINQAAVIREPSAAEFKSGLEGQTVKKILRRGKLLILELSGGKSLTIHLKMTGQLVYPGGKDKSRVAFELSDGKTLDFNDQRLFADLRLLDNWKSLKFIRELGPEPFEIAPKKFAEMLSARKTKIKPLLLDQTFIAGIGNLYAAESLFRAKIDPLRPASSLTPVQARLLLTKIKEVLKEAISSGGSSIDDYVRVSGQKGDFVRHHRVYGRKDKPCFVCKTPIKRSVVGGRGTFFCPQCQR